MDGNTHIVTGQRICMFVYNTFTHDARVHKEAKTLAGAGYDVRVFALWADGLAESETVSGYKIFRVAITPWHVRLIRGLRLMRPFAFLAPLFNLFHRSTPKASPKNEQLDFHARYHKYKGNMLVQAIAVVMSPILVLLFPLLRLERFRSTATYGRYFAADSGYRFVDKLVLLEFLLLFSAVLLFRKSVALVKRGIRVVNTRIVRAGKWMERLLKGAMSNLVRWMLMPFHRQFCFLDFYSTAGSLPEAQHADVYVGHDLNCMPIAYRLARKYKAALVYDSHEYYLERNMSHKYTLLGKWLRSRLERKYVHAANANITVNQTIADALGARYAVPSFQVIMNTPSSVKVVLDDNASLRSALSIPADQKICLYTGAITFNRGLKQTISCLKSLPDVALVFMGPGRESFKAELRAWAVSENVTKRVHFYGPVPSDQVTAYAHSADVGIAPIENACLSYYYCSPNKVFEYILAGLPIVASDFPELKKIVSEFDVGLLFDPASPASIATSIRSVLDDQHFRDNVQRNMPRAVEAFNWENEAAKLLTIFAGLPRRS